jgi:hypothetical protein
VPKPSRPLCRPLRVQGSLRTCRGHLPDRTHLVGAAALHPLVPVGQAGKFGLGRYGAISGRKSPLFDACRLPDQENFGQGFHPVRRREAPWGRDPWILVVAGLALSTLERCAVGRIFIPDLRASRYRVRSFHFLCRADMCPIRRFKFNRQ